MNLLYPFDCELLFRKYKSIRRELLSSRHEWLEKRIAILGGSTTTDIRKMLDLFMLFNGINAEFYESEYAQYWQDAMFNNKKLADFNPDIIYIHTSNRNIQNYPNPHDSKEDVDELSDVEFNRFRAMWDKLETEFACSIIQNNFELPYYRLMGNADASYQSGRVNFITKLNIRFYEYAQKHNSFFINDINWLSADYGLYEWSDPYYWYMYKYSLCLSAIPRLAHNVANIIKSIYGMNKKAFALDLDNTLWGGVIGDDGVSRVELGVETPIGEAYIEFQEYLKAHKNLGLIINVISKNEQENALAGLNHPNSVITPDDIIAIKANWEPKSDNLQSMAYELALLPESFVFVDDNPAERNLINQILPSVPTPEMNRPEHYIGILDRNGFFEVTTLTDEDALREDMYKKNAERAISKLEFADYAEYLRSLDMIAEILPFSQSNIPRITQLINKSNQFNLTTKRYTEDEVRLVTEDEEYLTLYGRLTDKFGDNGIVTVLIGKIENDSLHIVLWLMSCRVLKRDMEFAMMDKLVAMCKEISVKTIVGYYNPTAKNKMVSDFYAEQGFAGSLTDNHGNSTWLFDVSADYINKNSVIKVT